jgi:type VI secretion system protein ImpJ
MTRYQKVIWHEGLLLGPHHFQQWDNYHEGLLNSRLAALVPYGWGVLDLGINREAVANGDFALTDCRIVLPDGLLVDVPQTDTPPPARRIGPHFGPYADRLDVYLAVPAHRPNAANVERNGAEPGPVLRYSQEVGNVFDETAGGNERPVMLARGNVRILFGTEPGRDGYSAIKIAEVVRTTTGQLTLSNTFVPPALVSAASPWLQDTLQQLIEVLVTKSSTLGEGRRQSGSGAADFTGLDAPNFWLLHTVNSALPRLTHLFHTRVVHPERLYFELVRLAGELMTFDINRHPKDIAPYNHEDPYKTFKDLTGAIREMLELVIPTRCVAIQLEPVPARESLYEGQVEDAELLAKAEFYLAVYSDSPDVTDGALIDSVPRTVKIAAAGRDINKIIGAAVPGIALRHVSPPASIPVRPRYQYFALDTKGEIWQRIRDLKALAVYVPDEIPDESLLMYAVKPQ